MTEDRIAAGDGALRPEGRASRTRPLLTGWVGLAITLIASAALLTLSAAAAEHFGSIFHLHPAAALVGGACLYRCLEDGRPRATSSMAFLLVGLAGIAAYEQALQPRGLADPWPISLGIAMGGVLFAARILLRSDPRTPVASGGWIDRSE